MSGMFWIALELSIPKIGLNVMLSLTIKKLDAFKFDGVAESGNTVEKDLSLFPLLIYIYDCVRGGHVYLSYLVRGEF